MPGTSGCSDRVRIDPLHPGIVVVFVEPLFQCIFRGCAFSSSIVADQCHAGHHDVAAHEDDQYPGYDFSRFHRELFNPVGQAWIQQFEPDDRCKSPEKAVQQIDPAAEVERDIAVIPEYFTEYQFRKDAAQVFVSAAQKGSHPEKERIGAIFIAI